jgi:DNA-binding CsgD family transcriptional regulator
VQQVEEAGDLHLLKLEEAITLFDQLPPSKAHVRAIRHLYLALSDNGHPHAAQEMLKRAAAVAEQAGDRPAQLEVLGLLAALNIDDDGVRRLESLRTELTDADPPEVQVELAAMQLYVLAGMGRYHEMRDVGLSAIEYAAKHGLRTEHFEIAALYENVAEALVHLGDIEQAAAIIDPVTEDAPAASNKMLYTTRAHLDLLRNQAMRAEQQWRALYAVGWASLIDEACAAVWRVEFLIWQAQLADALTLGKSILLRLRETPPETYDQFLDFARPLLLLGQRACADLAEQARARRSEDLLARAFDESQAFAELRDAFEVDPFSEKTHHSGPAETLQWDAELTRLAGSSDAAQWRLTADAWHRLGRPQYAAYAQWREAEALLTARRDRSLARSALWDASRAAAGHQPLVDAISALARRARIDLHERSADEADIGERAVLLGDGTRPYGLTDRELAVLHLLAEGKTNTEIGAALYMSGKTASVHVTHILRKLGVTTRVQAATVAERLGLLDTADL